MRRPRIAAPTARLSIRRWLAGKYPELWDVDDVRFWGRVATFIGVGVMFGVFVVTMSHAFLYLQHHRPRQLRSAGVLTVLGLRPVLVAAITLLGFLTTFIANTFGWPAEPARSTARPGTTTQRDADTAEYLLSHHLLLYLRTYRLDEIDYAVLAAYVAQKLERNEEVEQAQEKGVTLRDRRGRARRPLSRRTINMTIDLEA